MKVTVNVDEFYAQLEHYRDLKYYSFASDKENRREEFFYNCKKNLNNQ